MYKTFVRPILEYASIVWAGAHCQDLVKLDRIQVDALRIVSVCTKRSNIANLYKECGWDGLHIRREQQILKLIFSIENGLAPKYLHDILPPKVKDVIPYSVRNKDNFIVPPCRLECFKRSCIPSGINLWNELDINIQNSVSLSESESLYKPPL